MTKLEAQARDATSGYYFAVCCLKMATNLATTSPSSHAPAAAASKTAQPLGAPFLAALEASRLLDLRSEVVGVAPDGAQLLRPVVHVHGRLDSSFRDSWFVIRFVVVVNFAFVYERTTTSIRSSRKTISTPSMEEMQNRTLKIQQLSQKSNSEITSFKVYFCSQNLRPSNRLLAVLHQSLVHV